MENKKPIIIGLIHAKWCIHCRMLIPKWIKMKKNINKKVKMGIFEKPKFVVIEHSKIYKLDKFNNTNSEYLNHQQVQSQGFPTIFRIKDGKIDYYKDVRDPVVMEKWFMESPTNTDIIEPQQTNPYLNFINKMRAANMQQPQNIVHPNKPSYKITKKIKSKKRISRRKKQI
jgi:thiol-disulfide isomerase/thioredoxin